MRKKPMPYMRNYLSDSDTSGIEVNRVLTSLQIDKEVLIGLEEIAYEHYHSTKTELIRNILKLWLRNRKKDKKFWRIEQKGKLLATLTARNQVAAKLYADLKHFENVEKYVQENGGGEDFVEVFITHVLKTMPDVGITINVD